MTGTIEEIMLLLHPVWTIGGTSSKGGGHQHHWNRESNSHEGGDALLLDQWSMPPRDETPVDTVHGIWKSTRSLFMAPEPLRRPILFTLERFLLHLFFP